MSCNLTNPLYNKLCDYSTKDLILLFNETQNHLMSINTATIRGFIMEILQARHKPQFDKWINADYPNDDINTHFKTVTQ